MKRSLAGLSLVSLMSLTCAVAAQDAGSEWYPLKAGTKWTYKVTGSDRPMTMRVGAVEKVGEVMCQKLESVVDDKVVASEHVTVDKDGIFRHSLNGLRPATPTKFLQLPVKAGDKWPIDTKIKEQVVKGDFVVAEEKAQKVGGKDYDTFSSDFNGTIDGKATSVKYWFAKDVGMVKLKIVMDGQETLLELEKYEAGK